MTAQPANISAFIDAARDSVAREIAGLRREAQREREAFAAEMRAVRAEWEARLAGVTETERRLTERLANLKDGAPGRDGADGAPGFAGKDGAPGEKGEAGKDGASVTLADVEPMLREMVAVRIEAERPDPETIRTMIADALNAFPAPRDGKDGSDGKSVTVDEVLPAIERRLAELVSAIPAPKDGLNGLDGKDGAPGEKGESGRDGKDADPEVVRQMVADAVATIPIPRDGLDGKDGRDGVDGKDGAPGERGPEGPVGALPMVKAWEDRVHYQGEVCTFEGGAWQATKDTGKVPPHGDWICIVRAGRDGADGRSPRVRDTWSAEAEYAHLDIVALNGAAFIARHDNPGACPGEGWQMIAMQGKPGKPGPAVKGEPGRAATVTEMRISDDGVLTIVNADGSEVTCDLYPLLSRIA